MTDKCKGLFGRLFGHRLRIVVDDRGMYLHHACTRCNHKIIEEL
ncbi:hypothetical protein [Achromobacter mucicolens]